MHSVSHVIHPICCHDTHEMVLYNLYTRPHLERHYATLCSRATLFQIVIYAAIIVPPFFIAYSTNDLWQYTSSYREQPKVYYKDQLIVQLCDTTATCKTWSSFPAHNLLLQPEEQIFPTVRSKERDPDHDLINDGLWLKVELSDLRIRVSSLRLLLFFEVRLSTFSTYIMQSLAYVSQSWAVPSSMLWVAGELWIDQKQPLPASGRSTYYNSSLINSSSIYARDFEISNILSSYNTRNVTTILRNVCPVWEPAQSAENFTLIMELQYPIQTILYSPGFWQLLKFAWVQYLAIMVVFGYVLGHVQAFVFSNQLILTVKHKLHRD